MKVWEKVPFNQKFFTGVVLNTTLSESMKIKGDYIHASFMSEFDNVDQNDFEKTPRHVKASYSEE